MQDQANQWIACKHIAGADDLTETLPDVSGLMLFRMSDGAPEAIEHVGEKLDVRHTCYSANVRASGSGKVWPRLRSVR